MGSPDDLAEMLEVVTEPVVALDGEGRLAFWNPAAQARLGLREEDAGADGRARLPAFLAAALDAPAGAPFLADTPEGLSWEVAARLRAGGGLLLRLRDVTALRDAERQAREAEETLQTALARELARLSQLETLMESVPAAVFIAHDREARVITGNRMAAELCEMPPGANPSKTAEDPSATAHFTIMRDGAEVPPQELPIQAAAARGVAARGVQMDLAFRDGRVRHIFGNAYPIRDEGGEPCGAIAAFVDVTDRLRGEQEIRRMNETLEARVERRTAALQDVNQQLESFCYSVSHDLRTPLRSIMGMTELLQQEPPEGEADPGYLDRIRRAAERMDALIQDLLHYSRLTREELPPSEIDLGGLVASLLEEFAFEHRQRGVTVENRTGAERVRGHAVTLKQALANLLDNAAKFTPLDAAPRLVLFTERRGGFLRLSVRDHGIGVPEAYRERVFALFERLHHPEEYTGTGMGLSIARRAVERMGGRMGCEAPGDGMPGAVFWIELPLAGGGEDKA
ncbi:MAG: ATP-binding protein [Verrucomicrobium sp.]|nr:ATP-binding protein [Verrucomicrobium sp.]